jgi:serine/threonine protein kinase
LKSIIMENGALYPGTLLSGRYLICDAIGKGGFGQTYLAEDHQFPGKRKCVVKQLQAQTNEPEALKHIQRLFKQEAEVLSDIGQLGQVPGLLAHFVENGEFYLVQEWIDGQDLSHEFQPGQQLSEHYVISILYDLLEVLEQVHQKGVIHRDIKPSNIMRRRKDGKLVLIDFGAVKDLSRQTTMMRESSGQYRTIGIGTPGFMPSEQLAGNPQLSSDIYAVGMLGIQALMGIKPGELPSDPNSHEVIWQNQGMVSSGLADVLSTMVRYDFRQRYKSAMEAKQALHVLKFSSSKTTVLHGDAGLPMNPIPDQPSQQKLPHPAVTSANQTAKGGRGRIPIRAIGWSLLAGSLLGSGGTLYAQRTLLPQLPPIVGGGTLGPTTAPEIPLVPSPESTTEAPFNGSPQTIPLQNNPVSPNPAISAPPLASSSAVPVAVDYTPLRSALVAGQWKIADQLTRDLVLSLTGRAGSVLRVEDVEQIPCPDVKQLNQLWGQASQGRFGFRAQQKAWQTTVGKSLDQGSSPTTTNDALMAYVKKVGWFDQYGNPIQYGNLTFATNSPKGHLPAVMFLQDNSPSDNNYLRGAATLVPSLAQRMVFCERQ